MSKSLKKISCRNNGKEIRKKIRQDLSKKGSKEGSKGPDNILF